MKTTTLQAISSTIDPLFKDVRILINSDTEETWFVAKDVLQILQDNKNPDVSNATKDLDEDELTRFKIVSTNSADTRLKDTIIVSESGLYSLIMRSRKPIAKPFQRLVSKTILPAIRKNGYYISDEIKKEPTVDLMKDISEIMKTRGALKYTALQLTKIIKDYMVENGETTKIVSAQLSSTYQFCHLSTSGKLASQVLEDKMRGVVDEKGLTIYSNSRLTDKNKMSDYEVAINHYDDEMLKIYLGDFISILQRVAHSIKRKPNIKPSFVKSLLMKASRDMLEETTNIKRGTVFKGKNAAQMKDLVKKYLRGEIEQEDVLTKLNNIKQGNKFTV